MSFLPRLAFAALLALGTQIKPEKPKAYEQTFLNFFLLFWRNADAGEFDGQSELLAPFLACFVSRERGRFA